MHFPTQLTKLWCVCQKFYKDPTMTIFSPYLGLSPITTKQFATFSPLTTKWALPLTWRKYNQPDIMVNLLNSSGCWGGGLGPSPSSSLDVTQIQFPANRSWANFLSFSLYFSYVFYVNRSSQPSMVHWLSSSIFPCLFVCLFVPLW